MVKREDKTYLVLADGLGSGVKANILASLTSKIVATMFTQGAELEDVVETIASTLPVCSERKLAYSTFTFLELDVEGNAYLVEYDNPPMLWLRHGRVLEIP
ncbi:MAG: SpoIIE family protein phosphatase [Christensenellales bacterium]